MSTYIWPIRRHALGSVANLRDLGGYLAEGGMTRWNTAFRSARLSSLTLEDAEYLYMLGIRTIIDLRMEAEATLRPDACIGYKGITYHHHSLIEGFIDPQKMEDMQDDVPLMSTLYLGMVQRGPHLFSALIARLADALDEGGILYHCTAGKDRTGLVTMFLMAICGADRLDMIAEYETSHTYNLDFMPEDTTGSDPQNMILLLDFLQENYGGPVEYLRKSGVTDETIARIRNRLLQPAK